MSRDNPSYPTPSQTWVQSLQAHLDLAIQVAAHLPANETLNVQELNKVLEQIEELRFTFLTMCSLYGFEPKK